MTNVLLYCATVLIWGSTWYAIEFQLGDASPGVAVSLTYRFGLAAILLFSFCVLRARRLRFSPTEHLYFLGLGLLLFGLNYIFSYSAQYYIVSALNAIVCSCMLWMNILNARLFLKTRIDARTWLGAACGIVGIIVVFRPSVADLSLTDRVVTGVCFSFMGALLASLGNILSQSAQRRGLPVLQTNAWGMCYGALFNAGAALLLGEPVTFDSSPGYLISLAYLSVFGSVVAFGCYLTLLGRIGAHRAGYAMVMFPLVALILSAMFEGMSMDAHVFAGVAFALAGNLIILNRGTRCASRTPAMKVALEDES
jgi:drug/metabolite transporter (DMT)-like permease